MAKFLTTHGVTSSIEKIIDNAKSNLYLISPYLQLEPILFERLEDACRRRVKVTIVFGKRVPDVDQIEMLSQLSGLELYYKENLHAKCYFNETLMVITSMNLYDFSRNNREMGVLISKTEDGELFTEASNETSSILRSSEKVPLGKRVAEPRTQEYAVNTHGFCIRCGRGISYAPDKPYCRECYTVWAEYENPDYEEEFCHRCGKQATTTIEKPLCRTCFKLGNR